MSHTRRAVLRATAVVAGVALAGCGDEGDGGNSTPTPTPAPSGPTETVEMFDSAFNPEKLKVEPGTTVVWENADSYDHTITAASDNWEFDVEVEADGTARHTFREDGLYDVYCRFHGTDDPPDEMHMHIAVGEARMPS